MKGSTEIKYITNKESRKIAKENYLAIRKIQSQRARYTESDYVTEMRDPANILEIENLHTYFFTDSGVLKAVNGVSFDVPRGSTLGVVGESGCGKSVTSLSIMQLVQAPQGQIVDGSIRFASTRTNKTVSVEENDAVSETPGKEKEIEVVCDIAKMPLKDMQKIRGREISMIFQEPMTSLNPVFTIGNQLDEVVLLHQSGTTKEQAKAHTIEMLNLVGIAMPEHVYKSYPHELSGGMRQRVMIAMALSCNPKLIIADEPTTALDVTIQAQILELLREIKDKISGSIMLITHDLGVIAEMADYVVVMYAGRVVEKGTMREIFKEPLHPYTVGLQKSKPVVGRKVDKLYNIPGNVPNAVNLPSVCYFMDRCDKRCEKCGIEYPPMVHVSPTHSVACHLFKEKKKKGKKNG